MRCFCSGLTRQNRSTARHARAAAPRRSAAAISSPVSTPVTGMPSSAQTWRVTSSLSPVTIFTATPHAAERRERRAGARLRRIEEGREAGEHELASRRRSRAVAWLGVDLRATRCRARGSPRSPSASKSGLRSVERGVVERRCRSPSASRTRVQSRSTSSGAPLTISSRSPLALDQDRDAAALEVERHLVDLASSRRRRRPCGRGSPRRAGS